MAGLRVLHIMASGAAGGGTDHLKGLLPELRRRGLHCQAAVGDDGPLAEQLEALGFGVHRLSLMRSRIDLPHAVRQVQAAYAGAVFDLVHFHGTRAAFFGAVARASWRCRVAALRCAGGGAGGQRQVVVYTAHGLSYRKQIPAIARGCFLVAEAIACRSADRVVSVSAEDLDDLRRRRFVAAGRGAHIANAVSLERFRDGGSREQARALLQLDTRAEVVVTVSRLVAQKSVADLIAAMPLRPGAVLLVIGDGPQRAALEQQARRRGVDARFLGTRADVHNLLPACDLFVLSSRWEGEPIALLEAMAAGVPCLATATPGAVEVLQGGRVGRLVEVGRVPVLAAAIATLLDDGRERARLSGLGRACVATRTHAAQAAAVQRLYEEAVGAT